MTPWEVNHLRCSWQHVLSQANLTDHTGTPALLGMRTARPQWLPASAAAAATIGWILAGPRPCLGAAPLLPGVPTLRVQVAWSWQTECSMIFEFE